MGEIELLLPEVNTDGNLASMQLPDMNDYNYWKLYLNRFICIEQNIEEWDYHIVKDIINFNIQDFGIPKEERIPIVILINSCGGILEITNCILDTIKMSTTPVWTVNMGEALSGGCLIFLAGEKRFTTDNSWCMAHSGSGGVQGSFSETVEQTKVWNEQVKNMGNYILERTGVEEKIWKKNKNKDWWLNANQQIEFGFATDKLESIDQLIRTKGE